LKSLSKEELIMALNETSFNVSDVEEKRGVPFTMLENELHFLKDLNEDQKGAFRQDAAEIEKEKREQGYLSLDLVAIGYYLIQNNIDKAKSLDNIDQMLTKFLDEFKNNEPELDENENRDSTNK
jgi:cupin superfamily acireductone dioxygenase involved in methionine salvage